jgi:NTP pyrophosphatase (non-canonical NTP hydrolase)
MSEFGQIHIVKPEPLTFEEYQATAHATAVYPHQVPDSLAGVVYCALGLAGEAGEVAGKVKKLLRDGDSPEKRRKIVAEVGDTLWYIPELLHALGEFKMEDCARENLQKLFGRKERGTLHGDGDVR